MPDQFTTTTTTGFGSRLGKSFGGVIIGLLMFFGSFGLLYWNEGRAVKAGHLVQRAREAVVISADAPPADAQGKTVAAGGVLDSTQTLEDLVTLNTPVETEVSVKAGNYIKLVRNVEMYAWTEEKTTKTKQNLGGSETEETTYDYKKEWTSTPEVSSKFKYPEGHTNPSMPVKSEEFKVSKAKVGSLAIQSMTIELPDAKPLILSGDAALYDSETVKLVGDQDTFFVGKGTNDSPEIGDVRIQYSALPAGETVTAFGVLQGSALQPYVSEKDGTLYRAFAGTKDAAIAQMLSENSMETWVWRLLGFLMMWFGLSLCFEPLTTFLSFLPAAGNVSKFLIGIVLFPVSLVLSIITILVSMILHNIVAVIIAGVATVFGAVVLFKKIQSRKVASAPTK